MPTDDFRLASEKLFIDKRVDVVEWSFDFEFNGAIIEDWCRQILDRYSSNKALIGHGVTFSALSAEFSPRQKAWLEFARNEFRQRKYLHASEHFGFSEGGPIAFGAPLPVPMNSESLTVGIENMKRFADVTGCRVGLENLALAFGMEDVKKQGEFIDQLISAVDGFLLLDLHNIYCQIENFGMNELELLKSYPLEKVRELHIAGGSWSHSVSNKRLAVRRDTHDDAVPQEVFNLVTLALKLCPNVQFVILERLAGTMTDGESQAGFREDYETMEEILDLLYV